MNSHPSSPAIAIIDPNTLAALGLKQLLQNAIPEMTIDSFGSMSEFLANHPEHYVHFFVAMNIAIEHRSFFIEHSHQTIVLTLSLSSSSQLSGFHSICINVPEKELVRSLLFLAHQGHAHMPHQPGMPPSSLPSQPKVLSDREMQVMSLIVQGYINKEIADQLHISLSTVITHRKNIMEKLNIKSVSALTVYAVMHGYVDINRI